MDRYISRQITIQNGTFIIPFQQKKQFETAVVPITDIDSSLDKHYQSLFKDKGFRKANQVLQHVNAEFQRYLSNSKLRDNNCSNLTILRSSTAIVSIGGADGSELKALMDALDSQHGILVEISPSAATAARARGINVVIEHDVIDAAHEVVLQLRKWQKQGRILTVLISCQSVLHELPSRSPTFTQEAFLQQYFTPLIKLGLTVMFYAREPCPPSNWSQLTDSITIRLFKLDKDDVVMLSNYIAQKLKIPSKVNSTHIFNDDTRVILPVVLAQEVLFKMLYWKDIAHFHYEMEEQLTSFQPQKWLASLKNIGMRGEIQYLTTEHFSDLYHKEEKFLGEAVAVDAHTGDRLEMPKCFLQLFASSEMSSRILMM